MTDARSEKKTPRKRKPQAVVGRVLVTGVSASTAFAVLGALALQQDHQAAAAKASPTSTTTSSTSTSTSTSVVPRKRIVIIRRYNPVTGKIEQFISPDGKIPPPITAPTRSAVSAPAYASARATPVPASAYVPAPAPAPAPAPHVTAPPATAAPAPPPVAHTTTSGS